MKLSKVLLSSAVALSLVFGAIACAAEEDDDDLNAITGSNNNYAIDFTNESSEMYRAYKTTYNKHLGGLCQITISKESFENGSGTIGYIFDLESNPNRAVKDPRTLCIVGFNLARNPGKVTPYISRYKNVTDIQDDNFGAPEGGAVEDEILALNSSTPFEPSTNEANDYVITVNVKAEADGYHVDVYDDIVEKEDLGTAVAKVSRTILLEKLGYTTKVEQQAAAVYVNVFAGEKLTANWHYADTYSAAEVVEE